ncbi:MAG: hypothetical protein LBB73_01465 [Dysgonamonadaceae bacterium]|jgi:hypothetical protein|nr:hypothetical protein [Dysgonamonadaceae bacterium]
MNLNIKNILLAGIFLMSTGSTVYSQGLFKNHSTLSGSETTNSGGVFAAENKPVPPGDVPGEDAQDPVGEGLAILTLLSGGYIVLKNRLKHKKYENE